MTAILQQLTAPQLHALACIPKDAAKVRGKLAVRSYDVDFGVQITGTLNVAGNATCTITKKPSAERILAAILATYGPRKRLEIADAITADKLELVDESTLTLVTHLINRLATKSTSVRRGAVAGSFDVAVID